MNALSRVQRPPIRIGSESRRVYYMFTLHSQHGRPYSPSIPSTFCSNFACGSRWRNRRGGSHQACAVTLSAYCYCDIPVTRWVMGCDSAIGRSRLDDACFAVVCQFGSGLVNVWLSPSLNPSSHLEFSPRSHLSTFVALPRSLEGAKLLERLGYYFSRKYPPTQAFENPNLQNW